MARDPLLQETQSDEDILHEFEDLAQVGRRLPHTHTHTHTLQRLQARLTCSLRQQLNTQNPLYYVCNHRLCLTRAQDDAKVTKQLADNAVAQGLA